VPLPVASAQALANRPLTCYFITPAAALAPWGTLMKENIHPNYSDTDISCACGAVYHTRSTKRDLKIGICSACHPFFTGQQKFIDTAGRIEKFGRRYGNMQPAMRKRA
jgi:large subunit ribosomal protein L31